MGACASMIAHHVSGKAVRDALFLSSFEVTSLPKMVIVAALFSIVSVMLSSRAMMRLTPGRLVPASFAVSGSLFLVLWAFVGQFPRVVAVLVYLMIVGLGSLLTSGFWSILSEQFDPRMAKKYVGKIAGAGTLGGILGGALAERVAAMFTLPVMLPVLAFYHFSAAGLLWKMRSYAEPPPAAAKKEEPLERSGWEVLKAAPYLRTLAALVLLGTVSAAMIDYVFKAQAVQFYGKGDQLLRFFAVFYSVVGVLSFVVQTGFSGISLTRIGMAKTVATLPVAVTVGGVVALVAPGLVAATIARALEAVFRGSLFRAGYELFYMPMPKREKRAAKPIVDVGFDRLGDAVGSGLVTLLLGLGVAIAIPWILTVAIVVAVAGIWTATRLHSAYIGALEHGLREQAVQMDLPAPTDLGMSGVYDSFVLPMSEILLPGELKQVEAEPGPEKAVTAPPVNLADPVLQEISELRSGDVARVLQAVERLNPAPAHAVPHLVQLVAWDDVYQPVMKCLRKSVEQHCGQLVDFLLDKQVDFTIRRRLPRVLSAATSHRGAEGLVLGLADKRFEVRYQCGRALTVVKRRQPNLRVSEKRVFESLRREVAVSRAVWESHRLLDRADEAEGGPLVDDFLRTRTSRSLEHVFTMLSLVLPAEPLKIAFHGLHTDDAHLRGTALEYLESILPPDIREKLWPLLEKTDKVPAKDARSREEVLNDLMQSNQSILISLEEMKKRSGNL